MAVSTKVIVIAVVAVLVVGGAGAAAVFLMNNNDKDDGLEKEYIDVKTSLGVYGNANKDAVMGDSDKEIMQKIIDGEEGYSLEKYPLADANCDGKVTDADKELLQKMIDREECTVNVLCLNKAGDQITVPVGFPLKNFVPVTSNMNAVTLYIDAVSSVAGVFGVSYPNFESGFADVDKFGGSPTDIDNGWANFIAKDAALKDQGGVGAVIIDHSKSTIISDEQIGQLNTAGIPLLWFAVVDAKSEVSAALALGFLVGGTAMTKSLEYAKTSWAVFDKIDEKTGSLSNDKKSAVIAISMGNKVPKNSSDSYETIIQAGGIPYWEVNEDFKAKFNTTKSTTITSAEVLSNYGSANAFMSVRSIDGKTENLNQTIVDTWDSYYTCFSTLSNYDKLIYVNNLLPGALKLAYMFEALYPDLAEPGYADGLFSTFAGICRYLDGCTLENTFTLVTYDDYVAAGGTHLKA